MKKLEEELADLEINEANGTATPDPNGGLTAGAEEADEGEDDG